MQQAQFWERFQAFRAQKSKLGRFGSPYSVSTPAALTLFCRGAKIATHTLEQDKNVKEGQIIEALPGTTFRILLQEGKEVFGHLSGKMRMNYIKVLVGDRVLVEFSPYDDKKGRIIKRL